MFLDADGLRPLGGHRLGGVFHLESDLGLGLPLLIGDERDVARVWDKTYSSLTGQNICQKYYKSNKTKYFRLRRYDEVLLLSCSLSAL